MPGRGGFPRSRAAGRPTPSGYRRNWSSERCSPPTPNPTNSITWCCPTASRRSTTPPPRRCGPPTPTAWSQPRRWHRVRWPRSSSRSTTRRCLTNRWTSLRAKNSRRCAGRGSVRPATRRRRRPSSPVATCHCMPPTWPPESNRSAVTPLCTSAAVSTFGCNPRIRASGRASTTSTRKASGTGCPTRTRQPNWG